jgi:hypothetical protein
MIFTDDSDTKKAALTRALNMTTTPVETTINQIPVD